MNRRQYVGGIAVALLALCATSARCAAPPSRPSMLPEGSRPPHFFLPDQKGHRVALSHSLGRNRIVVLFVPKSRQAAARRDLEAVAREAREYADRDLIVLAVAESGAVLSGLEPPHVLDILHDTDGQVAAAYGASSGDMTFYLIGKDGHIAIARHGFPGNADLFGAIDAMPMRRREMRERGR